MDTFTSTGAERLMSRGRDHVDPIVNMSLRYQDLISQIESPDTNDDDVDRLMSEAMDIEAFMLRIEPVSIDGYVASLKFAKHFR
jgi:hypothetical protein